MTRDLDRLLGQLSDAPLDRSLDRLAGDVDARIAAQSAVNSQTWGLRAAAAMFIAAAGAVVSASGTAVAAPDTRSPFAAWSSLAPSALLEPGE